MVWICLIFLFFVSYRAADAPPAVYESVPQVFDRIKGVANEDIVGKVQAIYMFDVEGKNTTRIVR